MMTIYKYIGTDPVTICNKLFNTGDQAPGKEVDVNVPGTRGYTELQVLVDTTWTTVPMVIDWEKVGQRF